MSAVFTAAVVTIGATAGSMVSGASGAQTEEEAEEQKRLAKEVQKEKLGLLGEQKGLALGAAESQFMGGQRDVTMGTQTGMRGIQEFGATAASKSGLATSGTIEQKVKTQTGDILGKYKSDMTKLLDTRRLSESEAQLSYRKGEMSAEEAYQNTLTDIESQPTGILEGMFS